MTVSFGVATMVPEREQLAEELVRRVDRAMYRAKQGGRNRIEQAPAHRADCQDEPGLPPYRAASFAISFSHPSHRERRAALEVADGHEGVLSPTRGARDDCR